MFRDIKKALILAPHTDDGEFGCGGTISRLIEQGVDVHYIAFSSCEQSVLSKFPSNILAKEVKEATAELGIPSENLHVLNYNVRNFNYKRQDILDDMIKFRLLIKPDLVFMPSVNDVHQDHATIAMEGIRAFKFCNLLSYELPWNNITFSNSHFVVLSRKNIDKKVSALKKYKSQEHRSYASEEFINSLATVRGGQIGGKYAEVFEVIRYIS